MGVCASSEAAGGGSSSAGGGTASSPSRSGDHILTDTEVDSYWVHQPADLSVDEKVDLITQLQRQNLRLHKGGGMIKSPSRRIETETIRAQESIDGLVEKGRHHHVEEHVSFDFFVSDNIMTEYFTNLMMNYNVFYISIYF